MQIAQLKPDVILSNGTPATIAFQQQTKDIPVVFTMVTDPVGQRLIKSLAQPGANLTGFTNFEFSMGGKWLGLLKEISPKVAYVAVLYHPHTAPYAASFLETLQVGAAASSVQVHPAEIQDASDVRTRNRHAADQFQLRPRSHTEHLHDGSSRLDRRSGCATCGARYLSFPIFCNHRWAD